MTDRPDPPAHLVDPSTITSGSWVTFRCPDPDCSHSFCKLWQPLDSVNRFGDSRCWCHADKRVFLVITDVLPPD